MNKIKFSTSNNAVTHLGRNLYSTTPPAIAELVANSYDAYATNVDIILAPERIIVIDNGKGLDINEVKEKYAIIGSEKQDEEPINGLGKRKPMGKKGIGKLAAFSLGSVYTVYSKAVGAEKWLKFTLPYDEMINTKEYISELKECELPAHLSDYNSYDHGFIVEVTILRRKVTKSTKDKLKLQLSRRFYIDQSKTDFILYVDKKELKLDSNIYYEKIQYLTYFGDYKDDELKKIFPRTQTIEEYKKNNEVSSYFKELNISGWVGTTLKPKDLKEVEGSSFANIIVLANNKIADEDILKDRSSARIANSYIVGEILADDLINSLKDPITSSRQGLDDSIPEVEEFIDNIDKVRNYVIEKWNQIRLESAVDKLPNRIKDNRSYKEWLSTLTPEQKKINNKLLDLLSARLDDDLSVDSKAVDSMVISITSVINNIEAEELISCLEENEIKDEKYDFLFKLMDNIAKTEDLNHSNLIRKRLEAIDRLEELMADDETPEKLFEKHLSDNPWLISPYWNIDRNNPTETDYLTNQEFFKLKKSDEVFKRNFLDICIRVAEEKYPIIIELKKNDPVDHAKVTYSMIYDQINNYRKAMIQNIPELKTVDVKEIKVIFILSEDTGIIGSDNRIELLDDEVKMLQSMNIEILKYNKIIDKSRKMYMEHIKYQDKKKLIPNLSERISTSEI
ncbi:ATP-binding protein [Gallicola sp. Sow4_E12]|uniref:ATP-binding protein n=1 Tax=Gallicola sp. Sow4_E12 TaxID=3438785 RepID=UPI003F926E6F